MRLAVMLGASTKSFQWIAFAAGALLAAILVSAVFDWALIALSALIGANLLSPKPSHSITPQNSSESLFFSSWACLCRQG